MKVFTVSLLSIIFVTLIVGSFQSISADHSEPGKGIFKDENNVNLASSKDSKYLIHLQVVVRDKDQLVSVSEAVHGSYIPHKVTDHIFDNLLDKKEIVTIDKIKYEKAEKIFTYSVQQYSFHTSFQDLKSFWSIEYCLKTKEHGNEQGISCVPIFQVITPNISLGENDSFTLHWTILREIN